MNITVKKSILSGQMGAIVLDIESQQSYAIKEPEND